MLGLALVYTTVATLTAAIYCVLTGKSVTATFWRTALAGVLALCLNLFIGYFVRPAIMGSFWGQGWLLVSLAIIVFFVGALDLFNEDSEAHEAGGFLATAALILSLMVPVGTFVQWFGNSYGSNNAARWGSVLKAKASNDVADTDPNHMVLVTKDMAIFKATQKMGDTGRSTVFKIDVNNGARQSIKGHLYYVFPIIPLDAEAQLGLFKQKVENGLGYVKVSLEDPTQPAELVERPLRYRLDGVFGRNALRLIYDAGYSHGQLADPTVEIDDEGKPFITVTLMRPAFGNAFRRIDKVITLNMETGKIAAYEPKNAPSWIDRIVPDDHAIELAREWGLWGNKKSVGLWNIWGSANEHQMQPADAEPMLLNTEAGRSVWVIPMTSRNGNDNSSVGLLLVDTRVDQDGQVKANYYQSFKGVVIGDDVVKAFQGPVQNMPNVQVAAIQYYRLNGEDAWVAIYQQPQAIGASLYRFAIMPVRTPGGASVSVATDKQTLLQSFNQTISSSSRNGGSVSRRGMAKTFKGVIVGMNQLCVGGFNNTGVETLIQVRLSTDENHIYQASAKDLPFLGFVKEGQTLSGTFNATNDSSVIRQIVTLDGPTGRK